MEIPSDKWSTWLLERRNGNNPEEHQRSLSHLTPIRDQVLTGAEIQHEETVLDARCGDGLLAFAALERTGPSGQVIFTDISPRLPAVCQTITEQSNIAHQFRFIQIKVFDSTNIPNASNGRISPEEEDLAE